MKTIKNALSIAFVLTAIMALVFAMGTPMAHAAASGSIDLGPELGKYHHVSAGPDGSTSGWEVVVKVPQNGTYAATATIPLHDNTKVLAVRTNWENPANWEQSGNILTVTSAIGMSRHITVTFTGDSAKPGSKVGLGSAPVLAMAEIKWGDPAYYQHVLKADGIHDVYQSMVRLNRDGTKFSITAMADTKVTVMTGSGIILGTCDSTTCEIDAPLNNTFFGVNGSPTIVFQFEDNQPGQPRSIGHTIGITVP